MKNLSLQKKLILAFMLFGLVPAMSLYVVTFVDFSGDGNSFMKDAKERLVGIREGKAFQIEELYKIMSNQVLSLSQNHAVIEATTEFTNAFKSYGDELEVSNSETLESLNDFYTDGFEKKYVGENGELKHSTSDMIKNLSQNQRKLQFSFISNNSNEMGEKNNLFDLDNKTKYGEVHSKYHNTFNTFLNEFSYYDVFIVSAKSGNIVYSVFKELDFATSLKTGTFKDSGLARSYELAMSAEKVGDSFFTEMASYFPSYEAPAQFVSAPIWKNGKKIGALIFQIPVEKLNSILTSNYEWKSKGQGDTGESYIIGPKKFMKSISRFLVEDKKAFVELLESTGASKKEISFIKSKGTTATASFLESEGANRVVKGEVGFASFADDRGVDVLSAFRPLNIKGLKWSILTEMDDSEALKAYYSLKGMAQIKIIIFAIIIFACAFFGSRKINKSLVIFLKNIKQISSGVIQISTRIQGGADSLAKTIDQQAASVQETSSANNEISSMVEKNSKNAELSFEKSQENLSLVSEGREGLITSKKMVESIKNSNGKLVESVNRNGKEMQKIGAIVQSISEKTNIINDIVFQTKLLSFNASVEAARAGEHGKGFSVVAEEIGALAQLSGNASKEISELITASVAQVNDSIKSSEQTTNTLAKETVVSIDKGLRQIENCSNVLENIYKSSDSVNNFVSEITSASKEQSQGVVEINQALSELNIGVKETTKVTSSNKNDVTSLNLECENLKGSVVSIEKMIFGNKKVNYDDIESLENSNVKSLDSKKNKKAAPMDKAS